MRETKTTAFYRKKLPHWEVDHALYFITMRLAQTLPREVARRLRALSNEARQATGPSSLELQRRIFREMDQWLDSCDDRGYLSRPAVADMLMEAIATREQRGIWRVHEYVIMPNHLHVFVTLTQGSLDEVLDSFRRWTGRRAKQLLGLEKRRFWQREWLDHWSRSEQEDQRIIDYIRQNPVKAGLVGHWTDWPYASWAAGQSKQAEGEASQ